MADLRGPSFEARGLSVEVRLGDGQPLALELAQLRVGGRAWHDLRLDCATSHIAFDRIECRDGRLASDPTLRLAWVYRPLRRDLDVAIAGPQGERWLVSQRRKATGSVLQLEVKAGRLARLAPFLPASWPAPRSGRLDARAVLGWTAAGQPQLTAQGTVKALAFSDALGLHAGEGVDGGFSVQARRRAGWEGRVELRWDRGEVFWSPVLLPAGLRFAAEGRTADGTLVLEDGRLDLDGVGSVAVSGRFHDDGRGIEALRLRAKDLALAPLWQILKPLAAGTLAGELVLAGRLGGEAEVAGGSLHRADVEWEAGRVGHGRGLFALDGVRARLPWRRAGQAQGGFEATGGKLWGLALGGFSANLRAIAEGWEVDRLAVPVLDGELRLEGVRVERDHRHTPGSWRAEAAAVLRPLSMEALSAAMGWPTLHGSLSAVVPRLDWRQGVLSTDGALLFHVFDGTAVVKQLRVEGLAAPVSHAEADVDMRYLDLDLITRAFSFGRIEGRLDVTVAGLVLAGLRPVRFSASVASSPGDYPRRISQRAVDNIAALGGGSATAALQKSFLRFFEDFRYRRIGLAGHLDGNVLSLSGLANTGDGFVIVEGGGIPALTVIGYNRRVDWNELLERLSRIRQRDVAVIR